jgi:hypothetical protein
MMNTKIMQIQLEIQQIDKLIEKLEEKRERLYFQMDEELEVHEHLAAIV